jgi:hypothetical protein
MTTQLEEAAATLTEAAADDAALEPDAEKGALFNKEQYDREDLQIDKIDGQTVDKIRVDFTGSVMLDRSDPADVAMYNRLTLGKECELRVAGKVSGSSGGYTTAKEGDLDAVVGKKSVKIETVWVLTAEEL